MKTLCVLFVVLASVGMFAQSSDTTAVSLRTSHPSDSRSASDFPPMARHTGNSWEADFDAYSEVEDLDDDTWQSIYEALSHLSQHPININTATSEEFMLMPFLTAEQIDDIMYHIYRYGRIRSAAELVMIPSLGFETRRLLLNFITFGDGKKEATLPSFGDLMKNGRHEVALTARIPFYERQGNRTGAYLGDGLRHSLRYDFRCGKYLRFGFVGSKDAGEPFFGRNQYGYDHYNYYLVLRERKALKTLALGCYKLSFGMGLVVNNGFSFGKMASVSSLGHSSNSIRAHASNSESNYFNGIATTVSPVKHLYVSAFLSCRKIDATLKRGDSTAIQTIVTDGYHRTETEMSKRGNTTENTAGGDISYQYNKVRIGLTTVYSHLSRPLSPDSSGTQGYKRWYPQGSDFFNIGLNYALPIGAFMFGGEVGINADGAVATINRLTFSPSYKLKLMFLQRFYSYKYNSLHAMSFAEGGRVQNESGLFLGGEWQPSSNLTLTAYTDWFYFPWKKYGVHLSSYGTDNLIQAVYSRSAYRLTARYRLKIKEKDATDEDNLRREMQQHLKLSADYGLESPLSFKTQIDASLIDFIDRNWGFMFSQSVSYQPRRQLRTTASVGYFHSSNYDSRLYVYERNLLYNFSFPSFYGEGMRLTLSCQYNTCHWLTLAAKCGCTKYFDRSTISSSHQKINGSMQTDLDLQAIFKF